MVYGPKDSREAYSPLLDKGRPNSSDATHNATTGETKLSTPRGDDSSSNGTAATEEMITSNEIPYDEQQVGVASAAVIILSIVICSLSVMHEEWGMGTEANSALHPDAPPVNLPNTLWILLSTGMVMIMTPGIALYYGGMLADEKMLNRMVRIFVNLGLVTVQWIMFGYSLAFAPSNKFAFNLVGDFSFVALRNVGASPAGSPIAAEWGIPHGAYMLFQLMFASTTTTILSGAIAHLMSFRAFCIFLVAWTTFVYDPICHAVWGGGILKHHLDFAGGTVVHLLSGVSAAAATTFIHKIKTNFREEDVRKRRATMTSVLSRPDGCDPFTWELHNGIPHKVDESWDRALGGATVAHNVTYVVIGVVFIWFGWFGFNGGAALSPNALAASALVNTNVAAGFGMVTWMLFETFSGGNPSAVGAATGAVCGLVGITPCAGYVTSLVSAPVGMLTAAVSFGAVWLDEHKAEVLNGKADFLNSIRNPQDVMATHGISGMVGTLLTGLFAFRPVNSDEPKLDKDGLIYGGGFGLFGEGCVAVLVVSIYGIVTTCLIVWVMLKVLGIDGLLAARFLFEGPMQVVTGDQQDKSIVTRNIYMDQQDKSVVMRRVRGSVTLHKKM